MQLAFAVLGNVLDFLPIQEHVVLEGTLPVTNFDWFYIQNEVSNMFPAHVHSPEREILKSIRKLTLNNIDRRNKKIVINKNKEVLETKPVKSHKDQKILTSS